MQFRCTPCNPSCCGIRDGEQKKIMLFPEEVERLERHAIALKRDEFAVIEDLLFPDTKNHVLLVASYRLYLERDKNKQCAFLDPSTGFCQIHAIGGPEEKPLVCRAYPIAIKAIDAVTREYYIDTGCPVIEKTRDEYAVISKLTSIQDVEEFLAGSFPDEFPAAKEIVTRLNWIPLRLRQLELEGKIAVPDEFSQDQWMDALDHWDRKDLVPSDDDWLDDG